jgi:hypothetical protein
MPSATSPSLSRRRKCLPKLYHSAKAGCLTMDEEMAEDLGIVINSSGGKIYNAILSPTLSSSSENDTSIFWESDQVACCSRDYMDQSTNIYGRRKFLEWPYVHYLSTHSNNTGCSSLTSSELEIASITGTHTGASKPS